MVARIASLLTLVLATACAGGPGREDRVSAEELRVAGATAPATERGEAEAPAAPGDRPALPQAGRGPDFLAFPVTDDRVVARVGGESLRKSQVFDYMLEAYPDRVRAAVAVMLSNRVLAAECDRWGITVPESEVEAWWSEHREELARRARLEYGAGAGLGDYLLATQGQDEATYATAARDRERAKRLLGRLVRFLQIRSDRVELRILSVTERDLAARLRRALDEGADFAALARQYSVHPSAEEGGRMMPVWREALNPALDGPAFTLPPGAVSDVVPARDAAGRERFQIVKVLARYPGRPVSWGEVEAQVLASLEQTPLEPDEWYMWQVRLDRLVTLEMSGL